MPAATFWFNIAEAVVWTAMGISLLIVSLRSRPSVVLAVLGATLLAFGASDVVETQTGAWWRPWWLLVWKGLCLAVIAGCLLALMRSRER